MPKTSLEESRIGPWRTSSFPRGLGGEDSSHKLPRAGGSRCWFWLCRKLSPHRCQEWRSLPRRLGSRENRCPGGWGGRAVTGGANWASASCSRCCSCSLRKLPGCPPCDLASAVRGSGASHSPRHPSPDCGPTDPTAGSNSKLSKSPQWPWVCRCLPPL